MKNWTLITALGLATAALVSTPILAQRGGGDRPSRACMQEIVQLCGRDRSQIRNCLQQKSDQLSQSCAAEVQKRAQNRRRQNRDGAGPVSYRTKTADRTIFYGSDQRQQIDVYRPDNAIDDLPLIVFVHGGGWSMGSHKAVDAKPLHFTRADYFFASAGYRVLPDAPVEVQAADIGNALQVLHSQAQSLGFDPEQIILMGHSAGAHLAALVSTDPQYAGDAFGAIKGVVLLDSAGYDVAANVTGAGSQTLELYRRVFGTDPARHKALSPITHVGGPDAPNWLALYVDERKPAKAQALSLVEVLVAAGMSAKAMPIENTDHGRMNREIGTDTGKAQTQAIDAFLASLR